MNDPLFAAGQPVTYQSEDKLAAWWSAFRKRRRITTRLVTSYRRAMDETVTPLVKQSRANLHRVLRLTKVEYIGNGDESTFSLEPVAKEIQCTFVTRPPLTDNDDVGQILTNLWQPLL